MDDSQQGRRDHQWEGDETIGNGSDPFAVQHGLNCWSRWCCGEEEGENENANEIETETEIEIGNTGNDFDNEEEEPHWITQRRYPTQTVNLARSIGEQWLCIRRNAPGFASNGGYQRENDDAIEEIHRASRTKYSGSGLPEITTAETQDTSDTNQMSLLAYLNQPESQSQTLSRGPLSRTNSPTSASQSQSDSQSDSTEKAETRSPLSVELVPAEDARKGHRPPRGSAFPPPSTDGQSLLGLILEPILVPPRVLPGRDSPEAATWLWTLRDGRPLSGLGPPAAAGADSSSGNGTQALLPDGACEDSSVELWRRTEFVRTRTCTEPDAKSTTRRKRIRLPLPRRRLTILCPGDAIRIRIQLRRRRRPQPPHHGGDARHRDACPQSSVMLCLEYFETRANDSNSAIPAAAAAAAAANTTTVDSPAAMEAVHCEEHDDIAEILRPLDEPDLDKHNDEDEDEEYRTPEAPQRCEAADDPPNTFCGTVVPAEGAAHDSARSVAVDSTVHPVQESLRSERLELLRARGEDRPRPVGSVKAANAALEASEDPIAADTNAQARTSASENRSLDPTGGEASDATARKSPHSNRPQSQNVRASEESGRLPCLRTQTQPEKTHHPRSPPHPTGIATKCNGNHKDKDKDNDNVPNRQSAATKPRLPLPLPSLPFDVVTTKPTERSVLPPDDEGLTQDDFFSQTQSQIQTPSQTQTPSHSHSHSHSHSQPGRSRSMLEIRGLSPESTARQRGEDPLEKTAAACTPKTTATMAKNANDAKPVAAGAAASAESPRDSFGDATATKGIDRGARSQETTRTSADGDEASLDESFCTQPSAALDIKCGTGDIPDRRRSDHESLSEVAAEDTRKELATATETEAKTSAKQERPTEIGNEAAESVPSSSIPSTDKTNDDEIAADESITRQSSEEDCNDRKCPADELGSDADADANGQNDQNEDHAGIDGEENNFDYGSADGDSDATIPVYYSQPILAPLCDPADHNSPDRNRNSLESRNTALPLLTQPDSDSKTKNNQHSLDDGNTGKTKAGIDDQRESFEKKVTDANIAANHCGNATQAAGNGDISCEKSFKDDATPATKHELDTYPNENVHEHEHEHDDDHDGGSCDPRSQLLLSMDSETEDCEHKLGKEDYDNDACPVPRHSDEQRVESGHQEKDKPTTTGKNADAPKAGWDNEACPVPRHSQEQRVESGHQEKDKPTTTGKNEDARKAGCDSEACPVPRHSQEQRVESSDQETDKAIASYKINDGQKEGCDNDDCPVPCLSQQQRHKSSDQETDKPITCERKSSNTEVDKAATQAGLAAKTILTLGAESAQSNQEDPVDKAPTDDENAEETICDTYRTNFVGSDMSPSLLRNTGESILDHHSDVDNDPPTDDTINARSAKNQASALDEGFPVKPLKDSIIDSADPSATAVGVENEGTETHEKIPLDTNRIGNISDESHSISQKQFSEVPLTFEPQINTAKVSTKEQQHGETFRQSRKRKSQAIEAETEDNNQSESGKEQEEKPRRVDVDSNIMLQKGETENSHRMRTRRSATHTADTANKHQSGSQKAQNCTTATVEAQDMTHVQFAKENTIATNRVQTRKRKSSAIGTKIGASPSAGANIGQKRRRTREAVSDSTSAAYREADACYERRFIAAIDSRVVFIVVSGVEPRNMACVTDLCSMTPTNGIEVILQEIVDPTTTICVMPTAPGDEEEARARTLKALECSLLGIPIVSLKWVRECVRRGRIVVPNNFIRTLPMTSGARSRNKGSRHGVTRLTVMRSSEPKNLLFQNTSVVFCGVYSNEKKKSIIKLLEQGGANVISTSRDACTQLKSIVGSSLTPHAPENKFVLLIGDRGKAIPKTLYKATKEALDAIQSLNVYVVDSNWVSLSIACAQMLPPIDFKPMDGRDLWHLSKVLCE